MYLVAKKNPDIYVIIAGGHIEDARRAGIINVPQNLLLIGRGFGDLILKRLYEGSRLVNRGLP
jgi:hypothetical protein